MLTIMPQVEDAMAIIWMRRRKLYTGKVGFFMWGGPIVAIASGAWLLMFGPEYGLPADFGYWLIGLYVWVWILIGLNFALEPWTVRRRFKKFNLAERSYSIDWDDAQVTQQDKNTKSEFPWMQFTGWREDKKLIVLTFDRIRTIYIPKRVFSEVSLQDFRRLLEVKVGPAGATRKL